MLFSKPISAPDHIPPNAASTHHPPHTTKTSSLSYYNVVKEHTAPSHKGVGKPPSATHLDQIKVGSFLCVGCMLVGGDEFLQSLRT